jgi:hypothetical protein
MNTTPQTNAHEKARADNTGGFIEYIADIDNATDEQRAQDAILSQLDSLHDDLGLPTNHIDNTRYLHDDISMRGGNSKGDKLPNTKGAYGLIMVKNKGEPVNVAAHMPNSDKPPNISDTTQASAYAIGSMSLNDDWWLVTGLSDAVTLYAALAMMNGNENVTVFACLNQSLYDKTLRHFAEVKTINIIDTAQHKDRITSRLAGVNAIAHIAIDDIISRLNEGDLISDLIADAETIELEALEWGDPEPLASDSSQPTPYPIEAWNGLLRRVIEAVAYYAQVSLGMAAQCVLGALAHMGQRFVDAPFGHGHKPASLILITEGESGSGKTEAMNLTYFKIDAYEKQQYEQYLTDLDIWDTEKASLKGGELKTFLDSTPKPYNPETVFKEATIETILDKYVNLEIINGSWATDDGAQFFNGHSMTSKTAGNALTSFTDLYSGGVVNRTRSLKNAFANPRTKAYDARFTLMLMAQRIILEPALTDPLMNGQGFLARALIACPEDLRGYRTYDDPKRLSDDPNDDPCLIEYWSRCQILLDPLPANEPNDTTGKPKRIKMQWVDKQTEQVFYGHMQAIENRQRQGSVFATVKAYASRMAENSSRIASLMAFFEGRNTITTDDITRAFMLVEYSTAERLRYLDATPTGEQNDSEKLSGWLVDKAKDKKPHKLGRTYISNNAPNPMRKNTKLLQSELDKLESAKHIRQEMEGRSKVVLINPNLYD